MPHSKLTICGLKFQVKDVMEPSKTIYKQVFYC